MGLRAAGSPNPVPDARLVVGAITGLMLGQLANPQPHFEDDVFRPALERLFTLLTERAKPVGAHPAEPGASAILRA